MVHSNLSFFFKAVKKRKALSSTFERKWDMAARRLISCSSSFTLVGLLVVMASWHLSRSLSIPFCVSMNHRNFLARTLKENMARICHISYLFIDCRSSSNSSMGSPPLCLCLACRRVPRQINRCSSWVGWLVLVPPLWIINTYLRNLIGVSTYLDAIQIFCRRESFRFRAQSEIPILKVGIWNFRRSDINKGNIFSGCL